MQATGGVDDDDVGLLGNGALHGVIGHSGGVGAHLVLDHGNAHAVAPDLQLLVGSGTVGVGSAQHHLVAGLFELVGQLADGRRLANAVHAHDHDDIGLHALGNGEVLELGIIVVGKHL